MCRTPLGPALIEEIMSYIREVKRRLADEPEVYILFLRILDQYRAGVGNIRNIRRLSHAIETLCAGRPEL